MPKRVREASSCRCFRESGHVLLRWPIAPQRLQCVFSGWARDLCTRRGFWLVISGLRSVSRPSSPALSSCCCWLTTAPLQLAHLEIAWMNSPACCDELLHCSFFSFYFQLQPWPRCLRILFCSLPETCRCKVDLKFSSWLLQNWAHRHANHQGMQSECLLSSESNKTPKPLPLCLPKSNCGCLNAASSLASLGDLLLLR